MKTTLNFLLGLAALILVTSTASAALKPGYIAIGSIKKNKGEISNLKINDSYVLAFAYYADSVSAGVYDIELYFVAYDVTNNTYVLYNAPESVSITVSGGIFGAGTTFPFPSGVSSYDYGDFNFSSAPTGAISCTTSPAAFYPYAIAQYIYNVNSILEDN